MTDDDVAPFRFTGTIARVVVEVEDTPPPDPDTQLRAAMNDQ